MPILRFRRLVATYILTHAAPGIEKLTRIVESIAQVHRPAADPCLSPLVSAALNQVAPVAAPHSWDASHRSMFATLPRPLQLYIGKREADRDRAVRQAQNAKRKDKSNGTTQQSTAASDQITH